MKLFVHCDTVMTVYLCWTVVCYLLLWHHRVIPWCI